MFPRSLWIVIAVTALMAAGCASGTLGKVTGTDELPKDLSPDQQHRFEVMENMQKPEPLPSVAPSPEPVLATARKTPRHARKKKKKRARKGDLAADEVASPATEALPLQYPSRRPVQEPIWVGERLSYNVSYFGVSAGAFVVEALPHKSIAGREVYHIKGTAETSKVFNLFYRLNDTVETFIDFQGFFPHRFHIVLDETKQARDALELYDAEKAQTFYWNRWNHRERGYTETKEFDPIPRFAQDSLSVLYYLRAVPLPEGSVVTVPVVSEGKSWEAVVTVIRREMRRTPMGKVMTVVVKPETRFQGVLKKQGDSFLWLTDDDRRVPVRLEAKVKVGTVVADLTEFQPGSPPKPPKPPKPPEPPEPLASPTAGGGILPGDQSMNKLMASVFFISLLAPGAAPAQAAGAGPGDATVAFASGQVQVISAAGTAEAKAGQVLSKGDVLKTAKDSSAILRLSDGSKVKLNPETRLEVASAEKGRSELNLQAGAVFSKVEKQGTQGRFTIRTKTAVMGVRGTEFYTAFGKASKDGSDVWMCVHEGKVEVESLKDSKKVLVNQGEGIFVPVGKTVTPPKKYEWTETLNWNMNPEAGELIDHTRIDYQELLKQDYD